MIITKIVVIIPVYNSMPFLKNCITSLKNQSFKDFYCIFVDDGSIDDSYNYLSNNISDNSFILTQTNKGAAGARNCGIEYAFNNVQSEYIMFIDSDDTIDDNYLLKMYNFATSSGCDIVCCSYYPNCRFENEYNRIYTSNQATKLLLDDKNILESQPHCKIYKMSLFAKIRYKENLIVLEDQATTYKLFQQACNVFLKLSYNGYHYNVRNDSLIHTKINNRYILDCFYGFFEAANDDTLCEENKQVAINTFSLQFLNSYPYFNYSTATFNEKQCIREILKIIKDSKIINKCKSKKNKLMIKKYLFLFSPRFYRFIVLLHVRCV